MPRIDYKDKPTSLEEDKKFLKPSYRDLFLIKDELETLLEEKIKYIDSVKFRSYVKNFLFCFLNENIDIKNKYPKIYNGFNMERYINLSLEELKKH